MGDTVQTHNTQTISGANQTALLQGKVAIITGASRGIGATAARVFAGAGATVVLAARDERSLNAVAEEIGAGGGRALAAPTDIGDAAAVERLVKTTLDAFGRLDLAFNNAGSGGRLAPLADIPVDYFDEIVRVNLRGVFLSMKYEIPAMLAAGGGAIVNVTSEVGLRGWPGISAYAASKHGVIGLTKCAALEYAAQRIRVNAIAPGPILAGPITQQPASVQQQAAAAVPLGRIGRPEEIAEAAVWLCSEHAAFITGVTLPVDGGQLAR